MIFGPVRLPEGSRTSGPNIFVLYWTLVGAALRGCPNSGAHKGALLRKDLRGGYYL